MSFFQVTNLKKSYWHLGQEISVLSGVNLSLDEDSNLSVVGQSGAGKSTLLHCLGLIDTIDGGEIRFGDEIVSQAGNELMALNRRKSIGFVFQFHFLMSELSALENVMVPLLIQRKSKEEAEEQARQMLTSVGLEHRLTHRPAKLSGGEQQRVAIARALVHHPKLVLADEPTGNLDPKTAEIVFNVLKDQCLRLKAILIMATHNLELAKNFSQEMSLVGGHLQS